MGNSMHRRLVKKGSTTGTGNGTGEVETVMGNRCSPQGDSKDHNAGDNTTVHFKKKKRFVRIFLERKPFSSSEFLFNSNRKKKQHGLEEDISIPRRSFDENYILIGLDLWFGGLDQDHDFFAHKFDSGPSYMAIDAALENQEIVPFERATRIASLSQNRTYERLILPKQLFSRFPAFEYTTSEGFLNAYPESYTNCCGKLPSEGFLNALEVQVAGGASAGENRIQALCYEENSCGIYYGFNGRVAADLLGPTTLYETILRHTSLLESERKPNFVSDSRQYIGLGNKLTGNDCHLKSGIIASDSFRLRVIESLQHAFRQADYHFLYMEDRPDLLVSVGSCVLISLGDCRVLLGTYDEGNHGVKGYEGLKLVQLADCSSVVDNEQERTRLPISKHPDDPARIARGKFNGKLKVTRAFAVGYLKKNPLKVNYLNRLITIHSASGLPTISLSWQPNPNTYILTRHDLLDQYDVTATSSAVEGKDKFEIHLDEKTEAEENNTSLTAIDASSSPNDVETSVHTITNCDIEKSDEFSNFEGNTEGEQITPITTIDAPNTLPHESGSTDDTQMSVDCDESSTFEEKTKAKQSPSLMTDAPKTLQSTDDTQMSVDEMASLVSHPKLVINVSKSPHDSGVGISVDTITDDNVRGDCDTEVKEKSDEGLKSKIHSEERDKFGNQSEAKTGLKITWADVVEEDNKLEKLEEGGEQYERNDLIDIKEAPKPILSRNEREYLRFMNVKRNSDYICFERVNGKLVNILQGLELHSGVFSAVEQQRIVKSVYEFEEMGRKGELQERTYMAPRKWMRGKGRVTMQFGCCYNYATDRDGNRPGILPNANVDPIPPLFKVMIRRLVGWQVIPPNCVPDSCIVNIYDEGDCIPPHIDSHDFVRPFCTISFLSECNILIGTKLQILGPGDFDGAYAISLPVGSVLVLNGNSADVAKHCVPSVPAKRISITFRKMAESKRPIGYVPEPDLQNIQPLPYEVDKENGVRSPKAEPSTRGRNTFRKTERFQGRGGYSYGNSSQRWRGPTNKWRR